MLRCTTVELEFNHRINAVNLSVCFCIVALVVSSTPSEKGGFTGPGRKVWAFFLAYMIDRP
jgi:hypothetical protein